MFQKTKGSYSLTKMRGSFICFFQIPPSGTQEGHFHPFFKISILHLSSKNEMEPKNIPLLLGFTFDVYKGGSNTLPIGGVACICDA